METPQQAGQPLNPYAPPQARVEEQPSSTATYFSVTPLKLTVMSLTTFNFYLLFWFYWNFRAAREITGDKLSPVWRAIFYVFTSYSLFTRIRARAADVEGVKLFPAGALAIAVLVLAMTWRLPDPFGLVTFLAFVPLLPVQATVNEINAKTAPDKDRNGRFRGWNFVALGLGGLLFVLAIVGSFMPQS